MQKEEKIWVRRNRNWKSSIGRKTFSNSKLQYTMSYQILKIKFTRYQNNKQVLNWNEVLPRSLMEQMEQAFSLTLCFILLSIKIAAENVFLKHVLWSALSWPYPFKFFKSCLPQISLGPFLKSSILDVWEGSEWTSE